MRRTTKFYKYERKYYTQLYIFFPPLEGFRRKKGLGCKSFIRQGKCHINAVIRDKKE